MAGPPRATCAHASLARDIKTDVLVMGAGITGASIADALAAAGVKVAVVDKRGLAKGSTMASTALVHYEIDTPLITLTRKIGKEKAVRAWRRSRLAVESLAARLGELGLADIARRDSLYLAGNVLGRKELQREHEARRASGSAESLPESQGASRPVRDRAGRRPHGLWQPRDRSKEKHARAIECRGGQRRARVRAGGNDERHAE